MSLNEQQAGKYDQVLAGVIGMRSLVDEDEEWCGDTPRCSLCRSDRNTRGVNKHAVAEFVVMGYRCHAMVDPHSSHEIQLCGRKSWHNRHTQDEQGLLCESTVCNEHAVIVRVYLEEKHRE